MKTHLLSEMKFVGILVMTILLSLGDISAHQYAYANSSWKRHQKLEDVQVSLNMKNASMVQVLKEIESSTAFHVAYMEEELSTEKDISLNVNEQSLLYVLEVLSREHNVRFTQVNNTIHVSPKNVPQLQEEVEERNISGKVLDEEGIPIPGVNVIVKGTKRVTVTDLDGVFSFENISDDAILVFSFIGFESQEITVTNKETVSVTLREDMSELQEVVVVGFGEQPKANLTGSVATVDSKDIENRPVTNVMNSLQGTAPGLTVTRSSGQPGNEGYDLNIRGISSVNGDNQPLVIVDGVEGSLELLNPNDIESVSVLKDAAASSIFGAKAANGVIMVTTKKGAVGKTTVTYSGMFTINKPYSQPELLSSYEQGLMQNEARVNRGGSPVWRDEQLEWMQDDNFNYQVNPNNPDRYDYYYNINKKDLVMRDLTYAQNHNLSIKGGNAENQYLISLGYYNQNGVFKFGPDGNERYNARVNLNTKFNDIFSLDSRISYNMDETMSPSRNVGGDYGLIYQVYQSRSIYPVYLPGSDDTKYAAGTPNYYGALKEGGYNERIRSDFNGVFTLKAQNLAKGLTLKMVYNPRFRNNTEDQFNRTVPFYYISPTPGSYYNQVNSIVKERQNEINHNLQLLADYDWNINEDHKFHVLGGYQFQNYRRDYVTATAKALISNNAPSLNFGSDPNVPPVVGDNIQTNAFISYFGRFNYSFRDKYLFEANLRNDISSKLAPGYRSKTFPSFSAGWILSEEDWFQESLSFLTQFKLRGSWGKLGNANVLGNYDYISLLREGNNYPFNNVSNLSLYQRDLASPEKSWESIKSTNFGVDFALFDYRLTGSFDYFVRQNEDMLVTVTLPATLGVNPSQTNSAKMETRGWEVVLGWRDTRGEFSYSVNFNLSDNRNKVLEYAGRSVYSEGVNKIVEGLPINTIFGYEADGYFSSADEVAGWAFQDSRTGAGDIKYLDNNNDGKINGGLFRPDDHGDLINLGNTSPRYLFGANIGFDWKGFDFKAFFQGVGERKMLIYTRAAIPIYESWRMPWKLQQDYWTPENQDALFPRLYEGASHNGRTSSHWVQDAAYIRLKNLQVGYTFKNGVLDKLSVSSARVFFSGQDMWEKTKMWFTYYDPENPNNVSYNYPFFRSYAIGLNVTF
ncbi:TonB-dependent receptor [Echinicola soli]|uniref:TonB-dependent receptor n=1 Tax=Echinicola soli TaxID=2591634 RepID=A0A514CHW1_9BACT|nr:TonB-dependent receptor [Echinicola soli]QDH79402.1 TonB-dependent receptor [Echinicola soli]